MFFCYLGPFSDITKSLKFSTVKIIFKHVELTFIIFFDSRLNKLLESSVITLMETFKSKLNTAELVGLEKENYPCLYPESKLAKNNRGNRCWECMPCCYWNLFVYFNQRSIDSLIKCTKLSLDMIKKKMQTANKFMSEGASVESKSALVKVVRF